MVNPTRSQSEMKLEAARLRRERDLQDAADVRQEQAELTAKLRELKLRQAGEAPRESGLKPAGGSPAQASDANAKRRHKYEIGNLVSLSSRDKNIRNREFKVVELMPSDGSAYQYRIKAIGEPNMRLAKEHELTLSKV